jgi:hypothetical protein
MLPFAITLLTLSGILLALALRGRLTARGLFCRKCHFDLAGLTTPDTCPECGRPLTTPKSTRPTLRRAHRPALAVAAVLFLLGATLTTLSATNNIPRILAALPDRVILALHAIHIDEAFTEIATNRLMRTNPLSDDTWRTLIEDALALQADENRAWDPRHGEVLANALVTGRLTDDEVAQYARLAIATFVDFPSTIRHGADTAGLMVKHYNSNRVAALNRVTSVTNGAEQLVIWLSIPRAGVRSPQHTADVDTWSGGMFTIPGSAGRSGGGNQLRLPLADLDWSAVEPESDLTMFVDYTVAVRTQTSQTTIVEWSETAESPVRVLPADAPIVTLNTDPEVIRSFHANSHARLSPIYIPPPDERVNDANFTDVAHSQFIFVKNPVGLSGDLYVVHDGRETRFCGINAAASQGMGANSIVFRLTAPAEIDEELLQSWLDAGSVTLELRPSPAIAERSHNIREILGVPLRFESVPVTRARTPGTGFSDVPGPQETTGRPLAPDPAPDPAPNPAP